MNCLILLNKVRLAHERFKEENLIYKYCNFGGIIDIKVTEEGYEVEINNYTNMGLRQPYKNYPYTVKVIDEKIIFIK